MPGKIYFYVSLFLSLTVGAYSFFALYAMFQPDAFSEHHSTII